MAKLSLFEQIATEGIVVHDQGTILAVNARYCEMFGYEEAELLGRSAFLPIAPRDLARVRRLVLSGDPVPYRATAVRKNGSAMRIECLGCPVRWNGETVRAAVVRDVTYPWAAWRHAAADRLVMVAAGLCVLALLEAGWAVWATRGDRDEVARAVAVANAAAARADSLVAALASRGTETRARP